MLWTEIKRLLKFGNTPIATGYFSKINQYIEMGYIPISICGKAPDWYKGIQYKKLAPKIDFFNDWKEGKITNTDYIKAYWKQVLDELDPQAVLGKLIEKTDNNLKIVLVCYEKPFDFCHRHIVAIWLGEGLGGQIHELDAQKHTSKGLLSR